MAKHKIDRTEGMRARRPLLLVSLVFAVGVLPSRGAQPSTLAPLSGAKTVQSVKPKPASVPPATPAKIPAQRKAVTTSSHNSLAAGKRDPFKLPELTGGKGGPGNFVSGVPGGILPPGARGLLIPQLKLEGVVWELNARKMIAVVTNETRRAYFLTENEAVYNGVVSKITPDSVCFRENVLDSSGRLTTREVVMRVSSAAGEGR